MEETLFTQMGTTTILKAEGVGTHIYHQTKTTALLEVETAREKFQEATTLSLSGIYVPHVGFIKEMYNFATAKRKLLHHPNKRGRQRQERCCKFLPRGLKMATWKCTVNTFTAHSKRLSFP